jgi:hypothetical protein
LAYFLLCLIRNRTRFTEEEIHMRYAFVLTFAALCTISIAAQTPSASPAGHAPGAAQAQKPAAPAASAPPPGKVTYTGCLKPGTAADSWMLENAEMAAAAGKSTATSGTASKMTVGLTAKPTENLKPHANHKIEVTGTISAAPAGAGASATAPRQNLNVESFKMVAATCP